MHPSTISRAIRGKYLQCQWGVFELAELFSHNVNPKPSSGITVQSQDMVRMQLRRIIDAEDFSAPRSDQEITEELQRLGISVARRTVAKYRAQMGIPAASARRHYR
jgi:RNA polymerase sigma-54 factor